MTIIGISDHKNAAKIGNFIRRIFFAYGMHTIMVENKRIGMPEFEILRKIESSCMIVILKNGERLPFYLDILILEDCNFITYELIKCVSPDTRLIYNGDIYKKPVFVHPNAISYGMGYCADATISSVDTDFDGISFVFCLQKEITSLGGKSICEGEFRVSISKERGEINSLLAAITCALVSDVIIFQKLKI